MRKPTVSNVVKTILAFDPDTRATGWAYLKEGKITAVGIIRLSKKFSGQRAASVMAGKVNSEIRSMPFVDLGIVEGQQIYRNGKADGNNLLKLAAVSGACLGALMFKAARVEFPVPRTWKGQAPKGVHQARVLSELGWKHTWQGPKKPPKIDEIPDGVEVVGPDPGVHWKEIVDAMGLALWGWKLNNK